MANFDLEKQFDAIKKSAVDAIKEIFPVEGKIRSIRLDKVWVEDSMDSTDYSSQAASKNKEATWGAPVYASLTLIEKASKKEVDKADKVKLFTLPKITSRFSYIVKGNEYQVTSQLRLKPGVYTLRKQNGELKTQINLAKGKNFDLSFNERTGIFYIQKVGGGQANIPLYPVLTYLGVSPSRITDRWGQKLESANRITDPKVIARAAAAFGVKSGELKEYFSKTEISPETTRSVLGQAFDRVDGPLLLEASKHLLDVQLGNKEPTDRDSLAFKELHSVEDYLHEKIQKNKQSLGFKLKRNIDNVRRVKLSQLVNPGSFNSVVESFFTQDDKAATPEQTNPLEMLTGQYRVTTMGSGGITSEHAITPEMREIHPSHYGFLDPVHTPESSSIGVNVHMPIGAVKEGRTLKARLIDKNGKTATLSSEEAFEKRVAFPSQLSPKELQAPSTAKLQTIKVLYRGKVEDAPLSKVDYFTPLAQSLFSWSSNLIPYLSATQGNRTMMASKMLEQAISLKHREAPLVQVGFGPTTGEKAIGAGLAIFSPVDGTVKKLTKDFVIIKGNDGKDAKLNLYNNFTLNRKSFINHEITAKEGDTVKKGQLLGDNNFTKGGELALGTNARVAYLPYKGLNFEDGIVITDAAAKKFTSEHIHKKTIELSDTLILNLPAFTSFYPNALTSANIKKLGKDGVIKKGETIKQGEALATILQKRTLGNGRELQ